MLSGSTLSCQMTCNHVKGRISDLRYTIEANKWKFISCIDDSEIIFILISPIIISQVSNSVNI